MEIISMDVDEAEGQIITIAITMSAKEFVYLKNGLGSVRMKDFPIGFKNMGRTICREAYNEMKEFIQKHSLVDIPEEEE